MNKYIHVHWATPEIWIWRDNCYNTEVAVLEPTKDLGAVKYLREDQVIHSIKPLLLALQIILDRSEGNLYHTDQVTGETFDTIARAAIAKAVQS